MTIQLPEDVKRSILAEVDRGHFASVDDALSKPASDTVETPDPLLGSMSDHAELMDQIVEDAMRHRAQQPWRLTPVE